MKYSLFTGITIALHYCTCFRHHQVPVGRLSSTTTHKYHHHRIAMSLKPIVLKDMQSLAPKKVTTEQWISYWGINKVERLQKVLESILVSYGGTWMAWFLSFMAGSFIASIVGTFLIFNWMYTPWVYAAKRNTRIWKPLSRAVTAKGTSNYYAVYSGRITSLNRIKRRAGKTIGAVAQEFLIININDENGCNLEIITQWQDSYRKLRKMMKCTGVIVSPMDDYSVLSVVTELYIPSIDVWVGDYPYLNRKKFQYYALDTSTAATAVKSRMNDKRRKVIEDVLDISDDDNDIDDDFDEALTAATSNVNNLTRIAYSGEKRLRRSSINNRTS